MADQKTEPESKPEATPESKPAETGERKVPESALTKQATDFRAENEATRLENEKMRKQLAAVDSEKLKAKEAKMLENGEYQKLLDEQKKENAELKTQAAHKDRALIKASARAKLSDLGMKRPLTLDGAIVGLPADATMETLDTWVAQMKVNNEAEFTSPVTPVGQASLPGGPATDAGGGDLKARLVDTDPKVRAEAFKEQFKNDLKG